MSHFVYRHKHDSYSLHSKHFCAASLRKFERTCAKMTCYAGYGGQNFKASILQKISTQKIGFTTNQLHSYLANCSHLESLKTYNMCMQQQTFTLMVT